MLIDLIEGSVDAVLETHEVGEQLAITGPEAQRKSPASFPSSRKWFVAWMTSAEEIALNRRATLGKPSFSALSAQIP